MESPFVQVVESVLTNSWRMLTEVSWPGTGLSVAAIVIGAFLAACAIRFLSFILGFGLGASGLLSGGAPKDRPSRPNVSNAPRLGSGKGR